MLTEPNLYPPSLHNPPPPTVEHKKHAATSLPACFLCHLFCLFNVFTPFKILKYTYFRLF